MRRWKQLQGGAASTAGENLAAVSKRTNQNNMAGQDSAVPAA
jgi:hypothetical protein